MSWSKRLWEESQDFTFVGMKSAFQKYSRTLLIGGIMTLVLSWMLANAGLMVIHPDLVSPAVYFMINAVSILVGWLLLSFLIQKFSVYQVLAVVSLLVLAMVAERYLKGPFNLVTIPMVILFWLGLAYLLLPQFFRKYRVAILSTYGVILSYFFVFRMAPDYVETHHQNFLRFLFIPIPVLTGLWMYEQWRWLKTLKAEKGKAELALLKSQINPHFFFNTLNNLYGLVVEKSDQAPDVVLKLSDMMRYTIYDGREELVPVKNEIEYLENYIELHKIRYQKKVEIVFTHEVEDGLMVAPLLFIILLENSFKHGVEKMRQNAFIHLRMASKGKQLSFTIENGIDETNSRTKKGIGLENLKKRLAYLYPSRHRLLIEESESTYCVQLNLELL